MSMSYISISMASSHLIAIQCMWKRELAHNWSKRTRDLEASTNQHCNLSLKPPVVQNCALLDRDTYLVGNFTARQDLVSHH